MNFLRREIVREALEWVGTPFHDCASVKGQGCDCIGLLKGVYTAVGIVQPFDMPAYPPQWFQHHDEPKFLNGLASYGARRVKEGQPGDIAMYNYGRHAAHGGIIIDERTIVHAFMPIGRVTKGPLQDERLHSIWSVFNDESTG